MLQKRKRRKLVRGGVTNRNNQVWPHSQSDSLVNGNVDQMGHGLQALQGKLSAL